MKNVDTVVEDIQQVLRNVIAGDSHAITEELLAHFGTNVADKLKGALTSRDRVRPPKTLYASEIGKPCIRTVWYAYHKPEMAESITPSLKLKFLYGDLLEELLLVLAEAAGHSVTDHQELIEISMDDGWRIRGRIDARIDGVTVDTKSASGYGFKKFQEGLTDENDSFGYRAQLAVYTSQPDAGFLVINKENGKLTYSKAGSYEYDVEAHVNNVIAALKNEDEPPPRKFAPVDEGKSGNMKLCTECSYCSYKAECWKDSNEGKGLRVFAYSGKPVFLVNVAKLPKVEEVSIEEMQNEE